MNKKFAVVVSKRNLLNDKTKEAVERYMKKNNQELCTIISYENRESLNVLITQDIETILVDPNVFFENDMLAQYLTMVSIIQGNDLIDFNELNILDLFIDTIEPIERDFPMHIRSEKAIGLSFTKIHPSLEKYYKKICEINGYEYVDTLYIDDITKKTSFITDKLNESNAGILLVNNIAELTEVPSFIFALKEMHVETLDLVFMKSLTEVICSQNNACFVSKNPSEVNEEVFQLLSSEEYNCNIALEFDSSKLPDVQMCAKALIEFAEHQDLKYMILEDRKSLGYTSDQMNELIELLDDYNLKIVTPSEGELEVSSSPSFTQRMN